MLQLGSLRYLEWTPVQNKEHLDRCFWTQGLQGQVVVFFAPAGSYPNLQSTG